MERVSGCGGWRSICRSRYSAGTSGSFQQIQKYERGTNRIGASRLQQIGKILGVPVAFFFESAPGGWEGAAGGRTTNAFLDSLGTRDGQALIRSFAKIQDVTLRRSIVDLVERLACLGGS